MCASSHGKKDSGRTCWERLETHAGIEHKYLTGEYILLSKNRMSLAPTGWRARQRGECHAHGFIPKRTEPTARGGHGTSGELSDANEQSMICSPSEIFA